MDRYYIEVTVKMTGAGTDEAEALSSLFAEQVHDLPDVIDADLGARLDKGEFDFCMSLDAEDEPDALTKALAAARCAIHVAGGATPGWEGTFEAIQQVVRKEPAAA